MTIVPMGYCKPPMISPKNCEGWVLTRLIGRRRHVTIQNAIGDGVKRLGPFNDGTGVVHFDFQPPTGHGFHVFGKLGGVFTVQRFCAEVSLDSQRVILGLGNGRCDHCQRHGTHTARFRNFFSLPFSSIALCSAYAIDLCGVGVGGLCLLDLLVILASFCPCGRLCASASCLGADCLQHHVISINLDTVAFAYARQSFISRNLHNMGRALRVVLLGVPKRLVQFIYKYVAFDIGDFHRSSRLFS